MDLIKRILKAGVILSIVCQSCNNKPTRTEFPFFGGYNEADSSCSRYNLLTSDSIQLRESFYKLIKIFEVRDTAGFKSISLPNLFNSDYDNLDDTSQNKIISILKTIPVDNFIKRDLKWLFSDSIPESIKRKKYYIHFSSFTTDCVYKKSLFTKTETIYKIDVGLLGRAETPYYFYFKKIDGKMLFYGYFTWVGLLSTVDVTRP